jgi:hypothetical protein
MLKETMMPIEKFLTHPALRPTVLAQDVLENVYRPSQREEPPVRPDASENRIARETPRAA